MQTVKCEVQEQRALMAGVFELTLRYPFAADARPGQFVNLYLDEADHLLPRPISICSIDENTDRLRLVYRVVGHGTEAFSKLCAGASVEVSSPLGNGFPLDAAKDKKPLLIGGGVGIPPMVACAQTLPTYTAVLGFADETFLTEDFAAGNVYIATESGRAGTKGNVLDVLKEKNIQAELIFACGPKPMLAAVKTHAKEKGIPAYLSLEERMACGIGACLACTCKTTAVHEHTKVKRARVCKDGPVFLAEEIAL